MEIGIGLPSTLRGAGRGELLEWARRAEARGFSTLGTIDRIVYPNHDPLIALAAAAAVTERIRLATTILVAPARANGAVVAKQAATLHALSRGRLVLGAAVGGREDDYAACGVPFGRRGRIFDEMLARWERIWSGEDFGVAGAIGPEAPGGRPRVIIGGTADAAFARAARHGDGWTAGNETPERFAQGRERAIAAWEAAGRDGAPHTIAQPYFALGERAGEAADRYLRDYYGHLGSYADWAVERAATDVATVRRDVREFAAAGCHELIFFPCDADPEQVDLLADAIA
ncbi:MAG TPA: LLM class flavin-dependent oxidoreductase [Solirubrobacteraceae bacterium]|nr:LLM class flavin-dependent oxidoreductase [Solirubrobacteraceae bacterium]